MYKKRIKSASSGGSDTKLNGNSKISQPEIKNSESVENHNHSDSSSSSSTSRSTTTIENIMWRMDMEPFAIVVVSLPLGSLIFCFITAVLFQHEEVIEVECGAKNVIPSISAVTSAIPQRFVWRICIALHSAPRLIIGFMYYNHYEKLVPRIVKYRQLFKFLIKLNFWVYTIENACLVCVTYISNKENYPVHEKIFVVFMFAAIIYMLLTCLIWSWARGAGQPWTELEERSFYWKKTFTFIIVLSTVGLLYFFYHHRVHCRDGAFSRFCICEYLIAISNIAFHFTGFLDFHGRSFVHCAVMDGARHGAALNGSSAGIAVASGSQGRKRPTNGHREKSS